MKKVFLVIINNGALHDQYMEWIDSAHSTREGAIKYLLDRGYSETFFNEYTMHKMAVGQMGNIKELVLIAQIKKMEVV